MCNYRVTCKCKRMSCWMAGLVSILLAECRSWKHMQLRCNLLFFLCTLLEYVCVCVCLLPYITHVPGGGVVVVSIVTLFQYNCFTVISAVFPHTHSHTHTRASVSGVIMNELWTVTEVDVTVGPADVLVFTIYRDTLTHTQTHTWQCFH